MHSRGNLARIVVVLVLASLCASDATAAADTPARQEYRRKLVAAAVERANHTVHYDPAYFRIPYPGGDVPADKGVCTDEVIRVYRALGIDLQKEVHEDMLRNFEAYPSRRRWGLMHPDANIDHRRVENLSVFFRRNGETLPITTSAADYQPGDIVTWDLGSGQSHIGIVVDRRAFLFNRYLLLHNIGAGPKIEDVLFDWRITGHFRYYGPKPPR